MKALHSLMTPDLAIFTPPVVAKPPVGPIQVRPYRVQDGITQSMLSTFLTCKYKSKITLAGWQPSGRVSVFDYGELIHRLIENGSKINQNDTDAKADSAILKEWHDEQLAHGASIEDLDTAEGKAAAVWPVYCTKYESRDANLKVKFIEGLFDTVWNGYRLRGKIDGLFSYAGQTDLWLLENKSKGQISEDAIEDLLVSDFQSLFYLVALMNMGYIIKGVLYNIIRTPQQRFGKKDTKDTFLARIAAAVREDPNHFFRRYEIVFTSQMLQRFEFELRAKLADFVNNVSISSFPGHDFECYHNETACLGRGACPFIRHCATDDFTGYVQTSEAFRELNEGGDNIPSLV